MLFLAQHFALEMHSCLLVFLAEAAASSVLRHSGSRRGELPSLSPACVAAAVKAPWSRRQRRRYAGRSQREKRVVWVGMLMWIFKCNVRGDHHMDNQWEKSKKIKARAPFERKAYIRISHVKKNEAGVMLASPSSVSTGVRHTGPDPESPKNHIYADLTHTLTNINTAGRSHGL